MSPVCVAASIITDEVFGRAELAGTRFREKTIREVNRAYESNVIIL